MTSNCFKIGSTLASKMVDSFSGLQDARGAIGREICQIRELDAQRMMQALARAGGNGTTSPTTVYVLGKRFDIQKHEHAQDLLERLRGIMWFSYRRGFQPVPRTSPPVTGDAGWGCMVRSSQMLLAQALRRHCAPLASDLESDDDAASKQRKPPLQRAPPAPHAGAACAPTAPTAGGGDGNDVGLFERVLRLFAEDDPSLSSPFAVSSDPFSAPFCFQRLVARGAEPTSVEMPVGQWYSAGDACSVIRDLVQAQARLWQLDGPECRQSCFVRLGCNESDPGKFSGEGEEARPSSSSVGPMVVYKSQHGMHTVYVSEVEKLCSAAVGAAAAAEARAAVAAASVDPLVNPPPAREQKPWDKSLLILIPKKMGQDKLDAHGMDALCRAFELPQCVGVVGGRRGHAVYFVGAQRGPGSQQTELHLLDPHTVQPALNFHTDGVFKRQRAVAPPHAPLPKPALRAHNSAAAAEIVGPGEDMSAAAAARQQRLRAVQSAHAPAPLVMPIEHVDPSLAFGFYCRSRADFLQLCGSVKAMGYGAPFDVAQAPPDMSNVVGADMDLGSDDEDEDDEEDDYVLIDTS